MLMRETDKELRNSEYFNNAVNGSMNSFKHDCQYCFIFQEEKTGKKFS